MKAAEIHFRCRLFDFPLAVLSTLIPVKSDVIVMMMMMWCFAHLVVIFMLYNSKTPRGVRCCKWIYHICARNLYQCCGILLTPLRWFKQIKRTVSFDVTTRFNPIQQSTAMYNSHILNVRNTTINVTKRSTINESIN